jgi:uroporphyrinogen-III synthase
VKGLFKNYPEINLKGHKILCVGEKTKQELIHNKVIVENVSTSSKATGEWIIKNNFTKNIVLFCGNIRRKELKEIAVQNNLKCKEVVVYETILTPVKIENKQEGIVFLSPSAVISFMKINTMPEAIAFCIGKTTAEEANKHFKKIEIADELTLESVIKKATNYYEDK